MSPEDVLDFLVRFNEASETKDFAAVESLVHPDAVFRFNDGDFEGLDAVRGSFENTWSHDVADSSYQITNIRVLSADERSGAATYDYRWDAVVDGKQVTATGRGTAVLEELNGAIVIKHELLSRT